MDDKQELPFEQLIEAFPEFVHRALLTMFNETIQKHYVVTGLTRFPDGKYVVRIQKKLSPED